jgi:hypothetical protein
MADVDTIKTVRREIWESYQCHVVDASFPGNVMVHPRLMLRWYEMLSKYIEQDESPLPDLREDAR